MLYFDNSVNGLRIGAPVKIKGVEIGSVKDIRLLVGQGTAGDKIPVIIEIDLKKLTRRGATVAAETAVDPEAMQKVIVDRGLRGQLEMESLVTGLLYVALDFFPRHPDQSRPASRRAITNTRKSQPYPPPWSRPRGALTRIINKLEDIDFKELGANLQATAQRCQSHREFSRDRVGAAFFGAGHA